jgi:hypothetical protein
VAAEVGNHLRMPQHVVGVVQAHGDGGGDRHGRGGSGSSGGGRHWP